MQKKVQKIDNAVTYILESNIFNTDRHKWILPLVSKVLDDSLVENDVKSLVNSLLPKKKIINGQTQPEEVNGDFTLEEGGEEYEDDLVIKKIISIDEVKNIGLLDIDTPLQLQDGLNIFYGRNGAGKSSIYRSLCKVLGKKQQVYPNVSSEDDSSFCKIKVEYSDGDSAELEWSTGYDNEEIKTMIFDNFISNTIVEQDQINEFKMAHLKMEYFSFLHNLYENIEGEIKKEKSSIQDSSDEIESILLENVPSIFSDQVTEEVANKFNFTKKETEDLSGYEDQLKILATNSFEATKRNLDNVIDDIDGTRQIFGIEEEDGDENEYLTLYYTKEYLKEVNKKVTAYNKLKTAFQNSGKNKVAKLLPEDWVDDELWETFISRSIDFVNSLEDGETFKKYTEEGCVYCHQALETKEAKKLIQSYQELHEEHKEKLDYAISELTEISELFQQCIDELDTLVFKNKKIQAEFSTIKRKGEIKSNISTLRDIFIGYKKIVDGYKQIKLNDTNIETIQAFWDEYIDLSDSFEAKGADIEKITSNKEAQIQKCESKAVPLRKKKILSENKKRIIKYLGLQEILSTLEENLGNITAIKQATSTLKTSFSREAPLEEFRICLKKEYENLHFTPNKTWSLKNSTRSYVTKRVYNIGDRRMAEIFSEGERKLHALADFFAECELTKYNGVYIFDDPVNSLDEGNIEIVAERILKLVKDGRQVIVFTHNLVFLNSLVDTEKKKINSVQGNSSQIILTSKTLLGDKQKLKDRMKVIRSGMEQFSKRDENSISEYELKNIYDLMSGYLEDYVEIIYFKNIINRFKPNIRMHSLEKLKDLDLNNIDPLIGLYTKTSRNGSRHSQPNGTRKPSYGALIRDIQQLEDQFNY